MMKQRTIAAAQWEGRERRRKNIHANTVLVVLIECILREIRWLKFSE